MKEFLLALLSTGPSNFDGASLRATSIQKLTSSLDNIPKPAEVFVLRQSTLFEPRITELLDRIVAGNRDVVAICVGLPLLLAIWQVYECRTLQWIGEPMLLSALLMEQREVISSLVSFAPELSSPREVLALRGRRFQCALFLLIDSVGFDTMVLSNFEYLTRLGRKLELEQITFRDLSPERIAKGINLLKSGKHLSSNGDFTKYCSGFIFYLQLERNLSTEEIVELYERNEMDFVDLQREFLLYAIQTTTIPSPLHLLNFDIERLQGAGTLFKKWYKVDTRI